MPVIACTHELKLIQSLLLNGPVLVTANAEHPAHSVEAHCDFLTLPTERNYNSLAFMDPPHTETSVDTLVYQLEDDDTNVRWNTLQKLRRIAAVETSHFPVRNTRRFLQCVRRRIVGEEDPHVAIEALRLLGDVMTSLGDNVDQILSSILPHLIPNLPRMLKSREPAGDSQVEADTLQEEMFQVFRKYTVVTNDLQAVADLLVNIGLGNGHGSVREASLFVLMRLLDERFQKRTMAARGESTRNAIGRGDKALIIALVQAIIPEMEDSNDTVVVAAEESIAKLQSYWGNTFSSDIMKFLSSEDKRTLAEHREPIEEFLRVCSIPPPSPRQPSRPNSATASSSSEIHENLSSTLSPSKVHPLNTSDQLRFGFLKADIATTLMTNTSNSNADWKKRSAAVEKLYAACKLVDTGILCGLTGEERVKRVDELEDLFDILVRLTQDVDVHIVKRALQITQIIFRKLDPPRHHDHESRQNDDNIEETLRKGQKNPAFYMTKMLAPMVEISANFAGDDDEIEGFVYALLGQVFESGSVDVSVIEQVLSKTSLRHRRAQVREEGIKVWMVLLLIANREGLLPANYAPSESLVQMLGRLLGDTNTRVRDLAFEAAAVTMTSCHCNIYALVEAFVDDEYVAERIDWAALRARLRRKHIPELRSNSTLRLKATGIFGNADSSSVSRSVASVEQSLDGVSELRMMMSNDESVMHKSYYDDNFSVELERRTQGKPKAGGSLSDRSYFDQQKPDKDGSASCREILNEGPTMVDIGEKLSSLRKKVDQLRQPRTKRVRRPNSQENVVTNIDQERDNVTNKKSQTLPRSKSSPEQTAFNPADEADHQTRIKELKPYHPLRDKRVQPSRIAVAFPASDTSTSSPTPHSPQHLQSLQSEARNYEDRPLKSKFIERQKELEGDAEKLSSSHPSPDERPIRPMANSGDPAQIYLNFGDEDSGDVDNNEMRSAKKQNSERLMTLATRKRLEAKAKQDAQACIPTMVTSPESSKAHESDTHKPWKKSTKSTGVGEVGTITRPSCKQEPRYLELHEITPLINPKQDLGKVLTQLQSDDWETNFDALSTVRRLATHHSGMIDSSKVHAIVVSILKQVPNLRSSVSKNALLALESMCAAFSRTMDSEVENIVPVLLKRCADSNTFVCESAAASLHTVVLKCSTSRVISALGSHVSSKSSLIRREVARGMHALILSQGESIHASKDMPSIFQLVGRCLEDSNNEVRNIAKQSVLYLHIKQRMTGERIKRYLPAAAQTKVDSVLSGKTGYAPPVLPMPLSEIEVSSEPPVSKDRGMIAAPTRAKKSTKPLSRRTSPPTSSNGTRSNIDTDELSRLETNLGSSNWKDRFDALNETTNFIYNNASALVESGQMLNLFDQLIKRLDDGNAKVNVLALESMNKIVPALGAGMEQVLSNLVPAITKNLANSRTSSLAHSVVQQLCAHADNRSLCQQFAIQARCSNSRVLPVLLDTLAQLTTQSVDDKSNYVLTRHVLPLSLDLLKEAKSGVREANSRLLRELRRALGSAAVASAASRLSSTQQDKLTEEQETHVEMEASEEKEEEQTENKEKEEEETEKEEKDDGQEAETVANEEKEQEKQTEENEQQLQVKAPVKTATPGAEKMPKQGAADPAPASKSAAKRKLEDPSANEQETAKKPRASVPVKTAASWSAKKVTKTKEFSFARPTASSARRTAAVAADHANAKAKVVPPPAHKPVRAHTPQRASMPAPKTPATPGADKTSRPHFAYTPYTGPLPPLSVESSFAPKNSHVLDRGARTASPAKTKLAPAGRKPRPASVKKTPSQSTSGKENNGVNTDRGADTNPASSSKAYRTPVKSSTGSVVSKEENRSAFKEKVKDQRSLAVKAARSSPISTPAASEDPAAARSAHDTALHIDVEACEPSQRRMWRRPSKPRQVQIQWYQSWTFALVLVVVLVICLSWTCWLVLLTITPNDTINFVMRTKDLDNGSFWLLHVWLKFIDLALQEFMLYQILEAGFPIPLVAACTVMVVWNAISVFALVYAPSPPSQIVEALVDFIALVFTHTTTLPEWTAQLTDLEFLHIEGKSRNLSLTSLPHGLFDNMNKLTFIHLGAHEILPILPDVGGLTNLRSITMARLNTISVLPADFDQLEHLEIVTALAMSLVTFPDLTRSRRTLKGLVIDPSVMCCNGFLQTCNLTSVTCGNHHGFEDPSQLSCLPSELSATPRMLEIFGAFNSTVCVNQHGPPPPKPGDAMNLSKPIFPRPPPDWDPDRDLEQNMRQCNGILFQQCNKNSSPGICYSDRFMPISCLDDPNIIQLRRLQIQADIGPKCNPKHESWLGCSL
ncbi:unnamed protein product [Phytophthora fragariaefolia]|uniref:Unnamed protein product n=1 Tax=Phytophthora fragariaefolia TaxID=1490495 RepID=A0A9W6U4E3_9STRA|nr:unnamed protein product [Phytophthora fragariaefolia]